MSAASRTSLNIEDGIHYPTEPTPMESGKHMLAMASLVAKLREFFREDDKVHAIGSLFLFWEKGNPDARRCPDAMVIKGVAREPERISYKTWVEGVPPTVIFELTSKGTVDEDLGPKKDLYERLGVSEYFLFDPLNEHLPRQLIGYRLIAMAGSGNGNGDPFAEEYHHRYEELRPDREGGVLSTSLKLRLVPRGDDLDLIDPATGKSLPSPKELYRAVKEQSARLARSDQILADEKKRADDERKRADDERKRADDEKKRADNAERLAGEEKKRAEELERRLAELLKRLPPENGGAPPG